jgi:MFS family permease
MGVRQTFGLYVAPVSADMGVGREAFGLAIAVLNLIWGAAAPFAGAFADKFGSLRIILVGAACYIAGLLLMSGAAGETQLIVSGVLLGLGVAGTGFAAVLGVVGRAAPPEHRQLALSLATMGSAVGQFLALPFAHTLMGAAGWQWSLIAMAGLVALMIPLGAALSEKAAGAQAQSLQTARQAIREALSHPGFWLLTAGFSYAAFISRLWRCTCQAISRVRVFRRSSAFMRSCWSASPTSRARTCAGARAISWRSGRRSPCFTRCGRWYFWPSSSRP